MRDNELELADRLVRIFEKENPDLPGFRKALRENLIVNAALAPGRNPQHVGFIDLQYLKAAFGRIRPMKAVSVIPEGISCLIGQPESILNIVYFRLKAYFRLPLIRTPVADGNMHGHRMLFFGRAALPPHQFTGDQITGCGFQHKKVLPP